MRWRRALPGESAGAYLRGRPGNPLPDPAASVVTLSAIYARRCRSGCCHARVTSGSASTGIIPRRAGATRRVLRAAGPVPGLGS
jgi:hypothetical protein